MLSKLTAIAAILGSVLFIGALLVGVALLIWLGTSLVAAAPTEALTGIALVSMAAGLLAMFNRMFPDAR
jgi:hypothetical protein